MTMIESVQNFKDKSLYEASRDFFNTLNIPIDHITSKSIDTVDIFEKPHSSFVHVKDIYAIGMLNDAFFKDNQSTIDINIKKDYQGILIFSIELSNDNPTRKTLADISRAFNKEYHYTPVVILFKYGNKLSLSNTQRQRYKINKEGEKTGKVVILRDVDIDNPHRGHIDILEDMKITAKVNSYESLYQHWQNVFDVSLLNKKFYQELSHWYFYAVREVTFPSQPSNIDDAIEHKSKNVIRLLTRFLFVWFIKEKGLIPNELFDEKYIKESLKDFNPKNMDGTLLGGHDKSSLYYKAILQNLFFASLNCPIEPLDKDDTRARGFRKKDHRGQNRDANFLMRYEDSFNDPQEFLKLINQYVPFLNGGLFECLDDKTNSIYIDGFSDNLIKPHNLIIPDYLFFGVEDHVDLSIEYGIKNKAFKNATVKGLIEILNSYKFTVAENTPIEEDVALDPELLGRVFENLLASYNPETKTTARKQTGSFYTPREIVSYMVDGSLIEYLKTKLEDNGNKNQLEDKLRELCSYSDIQPFEDKAIVRILIDSIDKLKAIDPAVGSGAFPMGMLQKMVHILSKLDPDNTYWHELQLDKAKKESDEVFETQDKETREKLLIEINNAFDETINNPDYARKLYIIENSIYGVDIQSIAIQITKLRFFISLVIEQNIDKLKSNFGIRPLPNLETKFIAANTLIGIENDVSNLFNDLEVKKSEDKLKKVRHRLFNAKTPRTKRKLRSQDKELREQIAQNLEANGLGNQSASLLAHWDPYDQNASSSFFDMEWMFGIRDGFDIVIGNPPYVSFYSKSQNIAYQTRNIVDELKKRYTYIQNKKAKGRLNSMNFFIEKGLQLLNKNGVEFFILDIALNEKASIDIRNYITNKFSIKDIIYGVSVFENVTSDQIILGVSKNKINKNIFNWKRNFYSDIRKIEQSEISLKTNYSFYFSEYENILKLLDNYNNLGEYVNHTIGVQIGGKNLLYNGKLIKDLFYADYKSSNSYKNITNISKYEQPLTEGFLEFNIDLGKDVNRSVRDANIALPNNLPFVNEEKIILRQSSSVFTATISKKGTTGEHKFFFFKLKDSSSLSLKFILALINSKLMTFYGLQRSIIKTGEKKQPQIRIKEFIKIPIKNATKHIQQPFINFVNYIMFLKTNNELISKYFEILLDGMVFELYFKEHMYEKNINIIDFILQDMDEIIKGRDFEKLDDTSKEEIINALHSKWTHPDDEVRNRIKLFVVSSPEILKPILES